MNPTKAGKAFSSKSNFSTLRAYTVNMYLCGLSPSGGQAPPKPGCPKSVTLWTLPLGARPFCRFPASALSSSTSEEMLKITQCHHPLPVGASGSYTVNAKLFVSLGALIHFRDGDMFFPVQPNPEKTWVSVNCPLKS